MRHCDDGQPCNGLTCEPCPVRQEFEADLIPLDTYPTRDEYTEVA